MPDTTPTTIDRRVVSPDTLATQIVRGMTEHFARGEIDAGFLAGVTELATRIRDEGTGASPRHHFLPTAISRVAS
jgi:hypothetical protein